MSIGGDIMEEFYEDKVLPEYKKILTECLFVFNQIPNTNLNGRYKTTYDLASFITKVINAKITSEFFKVIKDDRERIQSTRD